MSRSRVSTRHQHRALRVSRARVAALLLSLLGLVVPETVLAPSPSPAIAGQPSVEAPWRVGAPLPEVLPTQGVGGAASQAAAFEAALMAALEISGAEGATFAVVRRGELVWAGASGTKGDGLTVLAADSPMVIGSVTKTFVAALVLQLTDAGLLSLDDPLQRHLNLAELGLGGAESITVRQLLDHTSGLADVFNDTTRRALEEDPERVWSRAEVLATLHDSWYAPGEGWAYANTNYLLLAIIAERLAGQPLDRQLAERFLMPLHLDGTRLLRPDDGAGAPLAPGWATIFWGSGAMASTAADVASWGDALFTGALLAPQTELRMIDFNGHDHGLGVQHLEIEAYEGYGHTGLLNGYTSILFHLPAERVTVALLVNRTRADLEGMLTLRADGHRSLLQLALGVDGRVASVSGAERAR